MKVLPPLTQDAIRPEHEFFILSSRGKIKSWRVIMGVIDYNHASRLANIFQFQSDSRGLGIEYAIIGRVNCEFR